MRGSYPAGGFGGSNNMDGMWQAVEELRSNFEKAPAPRRPRRRPRRGAGPARRAADARLPDHPGDRGAQRRRWKPSAGSVYPTLQLLADEGLVTAEESDGRKIYSLTEAGREDAAESERPRRGSRRHRRRAPGRGAAEGRRRARPGRSPGRPHRHPRSRCRRPSPSSTRPAGGSTPSSPRTEGVTSAAGTARSGAGPELPRPLPPHHAVRRVASRGDLVVRALPAARRAGRLGGAPGRRDAALRAALPRARRRPRRPDDQGRPVPLVAPRRAPARDHHGAGRPARRGAPGAFAAIRALAEAELGVPLRRVLRLFEEPPIAAASLGQAHRARLARDAADTGLERRGQGAAAGHRAIVEVDLAALRRVGGWLAACASCPSASTCPRWSRSSRPRASRRSTTCTRPRRRTVRRRLRRRRPGRGARVVWERTTRRVLTLEDVTAIKITDSEACAPRASTRRRSRRSSPRSCSSRSSRTASSTPTRTPATSSSRLRRSGRRARWS